MIIVCTVLVARKYVTEPNFGYTLDIPPEMYDTTVSPNGRVYVKYEDYEFYPLYMVYYQRKSEDICQSRYFRANKQQKPKRPTAIGLQRQNDQQRRQEERQIQQQQQRQYQPRRREEPLWKQYQQHNHYNRNRRQQFHKKENNACLIL